MPTDHPTRLRAVDGGAVQTRPRMGPSPLVVAAPQASGAGTQLVLPTVAASSASLTFASVSVLERRDLGRELRKRSVRRLVDLRLGPVYRPFRLERAAFFELLLSLRVVYVHMYALADRYIGESWHQERYRQLLEAHYAAQRNALGDLRDMIDDGPLMAIVPSYSEVSERVLLCALERVRPGFECQRVTT